MFTNFLFVIIIYNRFYLLVSLIQSNLLNEVFSYHVAWYNYYFYLYFWHFFLSSLKLLVYNALVRYLSLIRPHIRHLGNLSVMTKNTSLSFRISPGYLFSMSVMYVHTEHNEGNHLRYCFRLANSFKKFSNINLLTQTLA